MDIDLARTFLEIVRHGSLAAAADKLHVTQTAITARVQKLESQLGCALFVRNRAGARLTTDGEAFVVYANQLVQTWEAARRDLPLPEGYRNVLHIGGEVSLCNPLMLTWARELRRTIPGHALRMDIRDGEKLLQQLELGLLDAAVVYQPEYWPRLQVEQLLEEKLILVRLANCPEPYVYIDWGVDFRRQHDTALPDKAKAAVTFNLGPWPCNTSWKTAAAATFARASCRAIWIAASWSGCPRRRSSTTRLTWSIPGTGIRRPCNRRSRCCGRSSGAAVTGPNAGIR